MTCAQCQENLLLYAVNALDRAEMQEVRVHLAAGCPRCEGRLAEVHAMLAELPLGMTPIDPPASAKVRLMRRLDVASPALTRAAASIGWFRPALVGGIAASLIAGLIFWRAWSARNQAIDALRLANEAKSQQIHDLESSVQRATDTIRFIDSPSIQMVKLDGGKDQPSARGMLLWNPITHMARFDATGLRSVPRDRTYELWLINDMQKKLPAGTFSVDSRGEATMPPMPVQMPGTLLVVAVTEEPAGGVPQPTSANFQLIGKVR